MRRIDPSLHPYFEKHVCYVVNTRADGTQQDSMAGVVIPDDSPVYDIIRALNKKMALKRMEEENRE